MKDDNLIGKRVEDEEHGQGTIIGTSVRNVTVGLDSGNILVTGKAALVPARVDCPFGYARCKETEQECATCYDCGLVWLAENYSGGPDIIPAQPHERTNR